jgi:hypothetical protein
MRFYDTSFLDFDMDHNGYTDAMMALTIHGKEPQIARGKVFLQRYADNPKHQHAALCRECLEHLAKVRP